MKFLKSLNPTKLKMILAMAIYGTIGVVVKYTGLPTGLIASVRGFMGFLILLLLILFRKNDGAASWKEKIDFKGIRKNLGLLIGSGIAIGANWIFLFEAYNFTTVAVASICNYLAPILAILLAPFVLKEKMRKKSLIYVFVAFFGVVLISGLFSSELAGSNHLIGVGMGIMSGLLYSVVILLNRKMKDIGIMDRTMVQMFVIGVIMLPYALLTADLPSIEWNTLSVVLLLILGIVHTGIAYALYFSAMAVLPLPTLSVLSYIDPLLSVILSVAVLSEPMDIPMVIGCVLIIGAAFLNEKFEKE